VPFGARVLLGTRGTCYLLISSFAVGATSDRFNSLLAGAIAL
jgi:hypothetical protein